MALNYYFCDGNTKTATSITMTATSLPDRQYTDAAGTVITETLQRLTFTASVRPLTNLRINYSYETRARVDDNPWGGYYTVTRFVTLLAGQLSVSVDVLLTRDLCYQDGVDGIVDGPSYPID